MDNQLHFYSTKTFAHQYSACLIMIINGYTDNVKFYLYSLIIDSKCMIIDKKNMTNTYPNNVFLINKREETIQSELNNLKDLIINQIEDLLKNKFTTQEYNEINSLKFSELENTFFPFTINSDDPELKKLNEDIYIFSKPLSDMIINHIDKNRKYCD